LLEVRPLSPRNALSAVANSLSRLLQGEEVSLREVLVLQEHLNVPLSSLQVEYTITRGPKGWQAQGVTGPNGERVASLLFLPMLTISLYALPPLPSYISPSTAQECPASVLQQPPSRPPLFLRIATREVASPALAVNKFRRPILDPQECLSLLATLRECSSEVFSSTRGWLRQ
jgi:hypothetical protein